MLMGRTPEVEPVTQPFKASSQVRLSQQEAVSTPVFSGTPDSEVLSAGLSPGADKLLKLFEWFHKKNYQCWPKQAWIAAKLACSVGSVRRWLAELVGRGLVNTIARGPLSSVYILVEKAVNAFRNETAVRPLLQSAPLCMNCSKSIKLASPSEQKAPPKEKTFYDRTEPEYLELFAKCAGYLPEGPQIERLAAVAASKGIPADTAGQLIRQISYQPRWGSPHRSIRNPLAYRLAVMEKELLSVRMVKNAYR